METGRLFTCHAELLDDGVAMFGPPGSSGTG